MKIFKKKQLVVWTTILMVCGQLVIALFTYKSFELNSELNKLNTINIKQDYINNIYKSQDEILKHKSALAKNLNSYEDIVKATEEMFQGLIRKNPNIFTYENSKLLLSDYYKDRQIGFDNLKKLRDIKLDISRNIHNIEMVYSYILSNELYKKYDKDSNLMSAFHGFLNDKKETYHYIDDMWWKIHNVLHKGEFKEFMSVSHFIPSGLIYNSTDFLSFIQNNIDKKGFDRVQNEINQAFKNTDDLNHIQFNNKLNDRDNLRYYRNKLE